MAEDHSPAAAAQDDRHASYVMDLAGQARRAVTPCGSGDMVWRLWGDGPPLVCLHGAHGSWTHWIRNIPALARSFTVLVPDLPGLGDSAMPPEPHTFPDIARIISEGLDRILPPPQEFDVAGFSFGASLAGHVAFYQGQRVRNCVFFSAGGMGLTRNEPTGLLNWRLAETDEERIAANRHNLGVLMFGDAANIDDLAVYIQAENTRQTRFKSRVIKERFANMVEALPKIEARLIGLWGECDIYSRGHIHEREDYLKEIQPDALFRMIPGAGHWVIYEAADACNTFIEEALGINMNAN